MKTPAKIALTVILGAGIFFAGYLANRQNDPATSSASSEQIAPYICPMHPQFSSARSGTCPICGMSLVLSGSSSESAAPGTVQVSEEKRQLAGIEVREVVHAPAKYAMRVPGRITVDESRLFRIVAAADGWIMHMGQNYAGSAIRRNQVLASYYTPSMVLTQQNLLYALGRTDQTKGGEVLLSLQRASLPLNLESAMDTLRGLGMDDIQIQEIQKSRQYASEIKIYSPIDGYVVSRNVSPRQRFEKGTELYTLADVSRVWIMTDIFEKDRELLNPGMTATVRYRGKEFRARISDALPQFDPQSRVLKTRFELDNTGSVLLPDMFVDVEIEAEKSSALTVPADAVVDSGLRKIVYRERSSGIYEPRIVETGWRLGDQVQITKGIEAGERIVTSGNFLIDSESRMKLPAVKNPQPAKAEKVKDPVCGMDIDPDSPDTLKLEHNGRTYYFCMPGCKKQFLTNPAKYTGGKQIAEPKLAKDFVCGMDVDPKSSTVLKTQYKGETYYFCNEACKKSFESDPEKYVRKGMAAPDMGMGHTLK